MTFDFEEQSALDAAGALTPDEQLEFDRALAGAPADVRAHVSAMRDLMPRLADFAPTGEGPRLSVKAAIMSRLHDQRAPVVPAGFAFQFAGEGEWLPHPVAGIRMQVLALNRASGYATLLLDVSAGARFPAHHHEGAEECYVISGSLHACGRRLVAGDFHHADAGSDHGELWTEDGCRVLLIVPPDADLPAPDYSTGR